MADKDYTADDMTISPAARKAMEEQEAQRKRDAEQERRQKGMEDTVEGKKPTVKKAKGGSVKSSASRRADGCATKGKTKGRFV
ncbi:hypothetical protein ORI99_08620 [Alishewanella sp. SMS9]|nr:hypothetical protein [Alishewanella sp. SMS9]